MGTYNTMDCSTSAWCPCDVGVLVCIHITPVVPVFCVLWKSAAGVSIARITHDVGGAETTTARTADRNHIRGVGSGSL